MILQQVQRLPIHFHLQQAIHARLTFDRKFPLLDEAEDLVPPTGQVDDPPLGGLESAEPAGLEDEVAVRVRIRDLEAEDGGHGGFQGGTELELVEAAETLVRVHDPVVVVHGEHEAAGEGVAVHPAGG